MLISVFFLCSFAVCLEWGGRARFALLFVKCKFLCALVSFRVLLAEIQWELACLSLCLRA